MKKLFHKYRSISYFTFSSLFQNFSGLIAGLITYRYIDPYYMGIWQSVVLIESYSSLLRIGIINGMNRELPFSIGQGNHSRAVQYAETTLFFTLVNIVVFVLIAIAALFFIQLQHDLVFPLFSVLLIAVINFYSSYLLGTFRANADFNRLSSIQIVQGCIKLGSIVLVLYWNFNGFIVRELLLAGVITILAHAFRPMKQVRPRWNKEIFNSLLKIGLPIFISSYALTFINTAPRLLLLGFGSVTMVGIYAPLLTIIATVAVLPESINMFLYPKMAHAIGKTNNRLALWKKALYTHIGIFVIGIPIVIACYYGIPLLIDHFIPKYLESKPIIAIGVFITLFMSYKFGYTTLITLKAWKHVVVYVLSFALLQFLVPLLLMKSMTVLTAVVFGQLISAFLMVIISLATNYFATHSTVLRTI